MKVEYQQRFGEANGNSKLTWQKVSEIERMLLDGKSTRAIATAFGVSQMCIVYIKNGKTWRPQ